MCNYSFGRGGHLAENVFGIMSDMSNKRYNRKQKYMSSEFHVKETSRRTHATHLAFTVLNVWIPARLNMVSAGMMMKHIYRIYL